MITHAQRHLLAQLKNHTTLIEIPKRHGNRSGFFVQTTTQKTVVNRRTAQYLIDLGYVKAERNPIKPVEIKYRLTEKGVSTHAHLTAATH